MLLLGRTAWWNMTIAYMRAPPKKKYTRPAPFSFKKIRDLHIFCYTTDIAKKVHNLHKKKMHAPYCSLL